MTENFKSVLENILKKDERLVDGNGELNGNLIHEYASSLDEGLIELLLNEEATREKFFLKVKDVYVFKQNDFKFFLDENKIDNSYTQYANRIGLSTGGKFLKDIDDVVLDFPYKDCVLEGGQSTEEGTDTYFEYDENEQDYIEKEAKRKEIFFNQILAKDEIDRLTEPKAFTNIKRYTEKGEEKITSFNRNEKGQITDNLIIKGNNLLALHALKEQFQGKVKLIYIDPPYNTGNDEFKYNDKFNHSTWLTFMKNRLEEAFHLLHSDGAIFISINHIELPYLSILLDQIFSRENKLPLITLKAGTTASYRSINDCPVNVTEFVIAYSKTTGYKPKQVYRETSYSEDYSHIILNPEETPENWKLKSLTGYVHEKNNCKNWREFKKKFGPTWKKIRFDEMEKYALKNKTSVVSLNTLQKPSDKISIAVKKSKDVRDKVFEVKRKNAESIYCYNGRTLAFFSNKFREIDGELVPSEILTNIWSDISFLGIGPEGSVTLENGKKPEYLLKTIIELITDSGDLVLDYHLGSGTTAAVAHKMNRQYIGVEQLEYGDNDSVTRLNNVINGDKTGVSDYEDIKWKGGGSFVYCELAKNNQKAIDKIMSCKSLKELITLFDELYEKYFLNYNVKVRVFKEKIVKEKEFQNLSLNRQKEIFARMLDLNQLYVNVSDMEDSRFKLSDEDIALTKNFYQL